jgi:hypothetical protein
MGQQERERADPRVRERPALRDKTLLRVGCGSAATLDAAARLPPGTSPGQAARGPLRARL